jgi:hypothetical protein
MTGPIKEKPPEGGFAMQEVEQPDFAGDPDSQFTMGIV